MESITTHLLTLVTTPPYSVATKTHPFLVSAAGGTLSNNLLSLWLFQDRIYAAEAYPRFIGSLISRIPFDQRGSTLSGEQSQRILKVLIFCLENIVREVEFFDNTAKRWGLDIHSWKERKGTRDYTAEMVRISNSGRIEEGLLFLWAMEKAYLDAWTNIQSGLASLACTVNEDSALKAFAANWSAPDFRTFVDHDLAKLVDEVYRNIGDDVSAERIWERVVELEEAFWPRDGEEHIPIKFDD